MDEKAAERLGSLQYLRGIAALMVVLVHWGTSGINPPLEAGVLRMTTQVPAGDLNPIGIALGWWDMGVHWTWLLAVRFGTAGVLIFFLISGFVIPMAMARLSPADFVVRRLFRILPVLWLSIALWIVLYAALKLLGLANVDYLGPLDYLANGLLLQDISRVGSLNAIVWTLLVEVKFYALVLVSVWLWRSTRYRPFAPVAAAGILVASNAIDASAAPYLAYMIVGSVGYFWWQGRLSPGAAIVCAAAAFAVFSGWLLMNAGPGLTYVIEDGFRSALIVLACLLIERYVKIWPRQLRPMGRLLDFLGRISYPVYLLHAMVGMPVIATVHILTGNPSLALLMAGCLVLPLSIAAHRFVEEPCRKLGATLGVRRPSAVATGAS